MRGQRNDPGARARAEAGIEYARRQPDTKNHQSTQSRRMKLVEWRARQQNTLRGFATVELPSGLIIRDVAIHEKAGKWWASLPARPQLDADGRQVKNAAGKAQSYGD